MNEPFLKRIWICRTFLVLGLSLWSVQPQAVSSVGAEVGYEVPRKLSSGDKVNPKTAGLTAIKLAKRGKHRNIAKLLREARR